MIILGIDPGYAISGYGVIAVQNRRLKHVAHGIIATKAGMPHAERLLYLNRHIKLLMRKYKPDQVAVEELFMYKNVKTAIKVGEARGVILLAVAGFKQPLFAFTPLQVKQALTTYGRASKMQVQKMVKTVLNLDDLPRPDDAADALAIAICCQQTKQFKI